MTTSEPTNPIEETRDACITHPDTCSNGGTMAVWLNISGEGVGAFIDSNRGTTSVLLFTKPE